MTTVSARPSPSRCSLHKERHDCEIEQQFHAERNRSFVPFGIIWQCPDCHAFWYRKIEHISGVARVFFGDTRDCWCRLTKFQTRELRKLVRKGYTQLEIARVMNFKMPSIPGCIVKPSDRQVLEQDYQSPNEWIFD